MTKARDVIERINRMDNRFDQDQERMRDILHMLEITSMKQDKMYEAVSRLTDRVMNLEKDVALMIRKAEYSAKKEE